MRPHIKLASLVPLTAIVLLLVSACGSETGSAPTSAAEGTLFGVLSIGPLCPVEPCANPTNPYTDLEVVVTDTDGTEVVRIAVTDGGTFSRPLPTGDYSLAVEPCIHLGCDFSLPVDVTVVAGEQANVEIDIDTGIR